MGRKTVEASGGQGILPLITPESNSKLANQKKVTYEIVSTPDGVNFLKLIDASGSSTLVPMRGVEDRAKFIEDTLKRIV